jgi:excinuclease ABC subunit A
MCPTTGLAYPDPEPNLFSFNSPYGACPTCNGLGQVTEVDIELVFPDPNKSVRKGGIAPLGALKSNKTSNIIEALLATEKVKPTTAVGDLSEELIGKILYGTVDLIMVPSRFGPKNEGVKFEGIVAVIEKSATRTTSAPLKRWAHQFMHKIPCTGCGGTRLKDISRQFRIAETVRNSEPWILMRYKVGSKESKIRFPRDNKP